MLVPSIRISRRGLLSLSKCLISNNVGNRTYITGKPYSISFFNNPGNTSSFQSWKAARFLTTSKHMLTKDSVSLVFVDRNGIKVNVEADIDDNLLDIAKDYDIDGIEGACGGTLACSTCHCIFKQTDFDRLGLHDMSEEELDMLDLAYGLTDTSRLSCALDVTNDMDGLEITVPTTTNDARDS